VYAAIKKVCGTDIKKNCAGTLLGGGRMEVCIKDHFENLSEGCKETLLQAAAKISWWSSPSASWSSGGSG
jgi:hypothetical protein